MGSQEQDMSLPQELSRMQKQSLLQLPQDRQLELHHMMEKRMDPRMMNMPENSRLR